MLQCCNVMALALLHNYNRLVSLRNRTLSKCVSVGPTTNKGLQICNTPKSMFLRMCVMCDTSVKLHSWITDLVFQCSKQIIAYF